MTRDDVERLIPGDSIIGLHGEWDDELPVIEVSAPCRAAGKPMKRSVRVLDGEAVISSMVFENDQTIRGPRRCDVMEEVGPRVQTEISTDDARGERPPVSYSGITGSRARPKRLCEAPGIAPNVPFDSGQLA